MSFWVQHGYGKGDKIERLCASGAPPAGVILSPSSESDSSLPDTVSSCRDADLDVLLDPESYVYSIDGADGKRHDDHGLNIDRLHWSDPPRRLQEIAQTVVDANGQLGIRQVVAPTPFQNSFSDGWASLSLQLARATIDIAPGPVVASVVVDAAAFADWDAVEDWLDAFTTIDVHGVYLITAWEGTSYPNIWDADLLQNIYRAAFRLSVMNGYEVYWGYSDIAGVLGLATGIKGAAAGWYFSLRHWTRGKWIPRSGGRQSAPRVLSPTLLSPLAAVGEADVASRTQLGGSIFPEPEVRSSLDHGTWGITQSWNQHMEVLSQLAQEIESHSDQPADRVDLVLSKLADAEGHLGELERLGVALEPMHRSRLEVLRAALSGFAADEGLV